jgi:uncharacterized protein YutE (UPF0331/DUF86 family)
MITEENLLKRINELLQLQFQGRFDVLGEIYTGTVGVASQIWGANCVQVDAIKQLRADMQSSDSRPDIKASRIVDQCKGMLRTIENDIKDGRLGSLRLEYQGQVFADLINVAKAALAEGTKDVAAVLAAAALEDTLKRYGQVKGLDVDDKDLTTVVNALKSAGLLSATQSSLLKGMVPFRNKALHAEWVKIDTTEVQGILAFVEEFLAKQFG